MLESSIIPEARLFDGITRSLRIRQHIRHSRLRLLGIFHVRSSPGERPRAPRRRRRLGRRRGPPPHSAGFGIETQRHGIVLLSVGRKTRLGRRNILRGPKIESILNGSTWNGESIQMRIFEILRHLEELRLLNIFSYLMIFFAHKDNNLCGKTASIPL